MFSHRLALNRRGSESDPSEKNSSGSDGKKNIKKHNPDPRRKIYKMYGDKFLY